MANVLLIMGSVRLGRRCPAVAAWAAARRPPDVSCEIVDLRDWPLPMDDEAAIPATGEYAGAHTRAWSRKIAGADGYAIVTPQYNWGYPAALKNALDHLYEEWKGKPLLLVTYGGHGGGKCAAQLRTVTKGLNMKPVRTSPALVLSRAQILGAPFDAERDLARYRRSMERAWRQLAARLR
ncbi:MAG TPA: NAD(P)H-dependent oxidoreductase [Rhizomicrobium sp.]|nr:NAD(P)H-dependent oxidoreductase [Rhizomicrobium sp.]